LGKLGDASVFSWRKFLPLEDGAALIVNKPIDTLPSLRRRGSLTVNTRAAWRMLDHALDRPGWRYRVMHAPLSIVNRLRARSRAAADSISSVAQAEISGDRFDIGNTDIPMTEICSFVMRHAHVAA